MWSVVDLKWIFTFLVWLLLSVDTFLKWTQPFLRGLLINDVSTWFHFWIPCLSNLCVPIFECVFDWHSGISIVYCRTVIYLHFYRICVFTTIIMSTESMPPVATAGGPPAATGSTVFNNVAAEAAIFDQEFVGKKWCTIIMLNELYRLTSCKNFLKDCAGIITQSHWIPCKACLAFLCWCFTSQPARC